MSFRLLRHILSADVPSRPRLYLDREDGTAIFVTGRSEARDEMLSTLPDRRSETLTVEGQGAALFVVIAPIPRVGRALQALGWGRENHRPPPQPAPRHAPQQRPPRGHGEKSSTSEENSSSRSRQ
jgi:hypothetical protein